MQIRPTFTRVHLRGGWSESPGEASLDRSSLTNLALIVSFTVLRPLFQAGLDDSQRIQWIADYGKLR